MQISQKKTCKSCRALERGGLYGGLYCSWGYKIVEICFDQIQLSAKPLEPCPKPRTYDELVSNKGNKTILK